MLPPLDASTTVLFYKLILAVLLGALLGAERVAAGKGAGMRTFALVSLGSCLFVVLGIEASNAYIGYVNFDPTRVVAGIVQGIGFLGAGLIILREDHVSGLTTAAGLWIAAAVGSAVGFGLYAIALFSSLITLFVFTGLWYLENKMKQFVERWYSSKN